jgi:CheY-like chemotaxis protein
MLSLDKGLNEMVFLIADDEPDNLETLSYAVTFMGGTTRIARNGREVMEALKDLTPTLILLDLSMPEMDGWETLKAIKARKEILHIPVIAVTAHAMADDKDKVMAAGFDGYIAKPFRPSQLVEEIRRALTPAY